MVVTSHGDPIRYGHRLWAADADPVRIDLPGMKLAGVHELRTLEDTVWFRAAVAPGTKVALIGGGYIRLEAASACIELGAEATVIESRARLLARVTGPDVAEHLLRKHLNNGTRVELNATVVGIGETSGRAGSVLLSDGREVEADMVSVGVRPNIEMLVAPGARCSNGVMLDLQCRTTLSDVYTAGACTCFPVDSGGRLRLESLQNAVKQGEIVAKSIMGEDVPYGVVPYFWSNQYDIKIKTIGLFADVRPRLHQLHEGLCRRQACSRLAGRGRCRTHPDSSIA
jgi:3-phenylpropionate/trans-cinnamate dioxygenase ferredoxin reductase subunit